MAAPRKFDEETRARAVRMYQERIRDLGESKLTARRNDSAAPDQSIAPARAMPREIASCTISLSVIPAPGLPQRPAGEGDDRLFAKHSDAPAVNADRGAAIAAVYPSGR